MKRIPWRSLLLWTLPLLAFAWLAVAGRAASGHPAIPPAGSLGSGAVGDRCSPLASYGRHLTTASLAAGGKGVRFHGGWNGRCNGHAGTVRRG